MIPNEGLRSCETPIALVQTDHCKARIRLARKQLAKRSDGQQRVVDFVKGPQPDQRGSRAAAQSEIIVRNLDWIRQTFDARGELAHLLSQIIRGRRDGL